MLKKGPFVVESFVIIVHLIMSTPINLFDSCLFFKTLIMQYPKLSNT